MIKALLITLLTATLAHGQYDARTADYVRAWRIGAAGVAFPTNGLVAYWSFDSVSGTTVFDDVSGVNLTLQSNNTISFDEASGIFNNGAGLGTGNNNYMERSLGLGTGTNYTLSVWVRPNVTAMNQQVHAARILSDEDSQVGDRRDFILYYNQNTQAYVFNVFEHADTSFDHIVISSNVLHNTWQHLVAICDASNQTITLYVDGVANSNPLTITPSERSRFFAVGALSFSRSNDNAKYRGDIDEIAIWNRALSSNEVSEIYNNGKGRFYTP